MIFHLFSRFVLISLLAFGGGGAALPLVERLDVSETGWLVPQDFAAAVAFGYLTPGPLLITGTFVGYRAAGLSGALTATVGTAPRSDALRLTRIRRRSGASRSRFLY